MQLRSSTVTRTVLTAPHEPFRQVEILPAIRLELLSVALLAWLGASRPIALIVAALLLSMAIRWAWVGAVLLHGLGHALLRAVVDADASALRPAELLEHQPPERLVRSLLPLAPIGFGGGAEPSLPWVEVGDPTPWKVRLKAAGGLLLNLLAMLAAFALLEPILSAPGLEPGSLARSVGVCALGGLAAANGLLLLASQSDWAAIVSGRADRFHCGNFGFIARREAVAAGELLSAQAIDRFRAMAVQTEVRGAQAGGGVVLARDRSGRVQIVGHRLVNGKRRDLTRSLEAAFRRKRRRAVRHGLRPLPITTAAWHYRFGTSGPPAVQETHSHAWSPARSGRIWEIRDGRWIAAERNIHHCITHNGDFEGLELFGGFVDHATVGRWLERVLERRNPSVGDSAKIAGMLDLLITQGSWPASLRLGYQRVIAPAAGRPGSVPAAADLQRWAELFDRCFSEHVGALPAPECFLSSPRRQRFQLELLERIRQEQSLAGWSDRRLWGWIESSTQAFCHNDPARATAEFLRQARGSFGLVVLSTLMPEQVVLASLGQPMAIGFDPGAGLSLFASEPAAVDGVLGQVPQAFRVDLNQNTGEIAVLGAEQLQIHCLSEDHHLSQAQIADRRILYRQLSELQPHLQLTAAPAPREVDPVAADLRAVPGLLQTIKADWIDPSSPNRQSAEYFANFLVAKAKNLFEKQDRLARLGLDPALARSSHVDILIAGVENSLWVGEQFARDLETIFPLLNVRALSSNRILQKLQHDLDSLGLARQSIVLAISQSGQTFPTRQVIEALDLFVREGVIREVFLLTGEPTSFLGSPILRPTFAGEPFCRRLFTNGSGRRSAEPATATVAAAHQTLTELLFCACRHIQIAFPDRRPLGMTLGSGSLLVLENMEDHLFLQSVSEITGTDLDGREIAAPLRRRIVAAGGQWGRHVLDEPIAWALHTLYVLISVGWVIPFGTSLPLVGTLWKALAPALGFQAASLPFEAASTLVVCADLGIYIFGPWLWTLGRRGWQGRQLLARTGRRTVVIGDCGWVQKLLANYVSKLFSLSYGIASLDVHGSDPQDELVHEHAHRVARGTLLYLGVPDGRCSEKQRSEENAVLLSGRQAHGIQNLGSGPEIVLVGSNPAIASCGPGEALVLPSPLHTSCDEHGPGMRSDRVMESLRESRFGSFRRLLAGYVFFWSMARTVAGLPLLHYEFWKSQSRTKVMTTAAPVSAARLSCPEEEEAASLGLSAYAHREQS